jgi:dipeptidyl aminopeptidase/acylaminoacyl peptidase
MSLSAKSTEQLFKEGIAAARSQDNTTARSRFREIIKRDDQSEKGWMWLSSVIDDKDEKRSCVEKVLQINPDNQSARREMIALLSAATAQVAPENKAAAAGRGGLGKKVNAQKTNDATDSGKKRRASPLILIALLAVLVLVLVVVVIKPSGSSDNIAPSTIAGAAAAQPGTQAATVVASATSIVTAGAGTVAGNATLPPTAGPSSVAVVAAATVNVTGAVVALNNTLPPTWTPQASATAVVQASGTPLAAPPTGLTGHLLIATGTILTNDAFLSIVTMKPDGTERASIVSDPDRGEHAVYTPDGKYVIYVYVTSGTGSQLLRIANRDGSKPRDLSAAWGNLPPLDIRSSLSLSSNGRYLAFSGLSILQNETDPAIYVLDMQSYLAGKLPTTPSPTPKPVKATVPPQLTPSTPSATPSLADLYLVRLTAKDTGANRWPAIAPDGKTLIYTNQSPNSAKPLIELYRVPVKANSEPTALTSDGATLVKNSPAWSADGKYIAFTSNPLDNSYSDIEIMLADGTGRHVLLHQDKVHNVRPHWSPDGKFIAFTSDRSGANEVYLVNVSTTVTYQVTSNGQNNFVTDWSAN